MTPREAVQDMKPLDAVDYLLGVVEAQTSLTVVSPHTVDQWPFHYSQSERGILVALHMRVGITVRNSTLETAMHAHLEGSKAENTLAILKVHICRLRKKIPENVKIRAVWGAGYRMEIEE
jgi:DNA-binding response OmpR family regulator